MIKKIGFLVFALSLLSISFNSESFAVNEEKNSYPLSDSELIEKYLLHKYPKEIKEEYVKKYKESVIAQRNWSNDVDLEKAKELARKKGEDPYKVIPALNKDFTIMRPGEIGTNGDILVTLDTNSSKGLFEIGHAGIVSNYNNDNEYTVESFPSGDGMSQCYFH